MPLKSIILYTMPTGPNPYKVEIILRELEIPYTRNLIEFSNIKGPEFTAINPNGRVPAIHDPNTGIVLWESCAIIEYIIEQYDEDSKISYNSFPERQLLRQWEYFQASGQGPYFGQAGWFAAIHPEKLPSVQTRYLDEVKRIWQVIDSALARNGTGWLVGNKCTYADLSFVMWNEVIKDFLPDFDLATVPHYRKWHTALMERAAVKDTWETRNKLMSEA